MSNRQFLPISNLTQTGLVTEVDPANLKENGFVRLKNLMPRDGRLVDATFFGPSIDASPVFSSQGTFNHCRVWRMLNGKLMYVRGGTFLEMVDEDGNKSAVPYWLGMFGTTNSTTTAIGHILGSDSARDGWTADQFIQNPGQSGLEPNDELFISEIEAGNIHVADDLSPDGDPDGNIWGYLNAADWTTTITSGIMTPDSTFGGVVSDYTTTTLNNLFITIRNATLGAYDSANDNAIGIGFRDSTTKRGYAVRVEMKATDNTSEGWSAEDVLLHTFAGYMGASTIYTQCVQLDWRTFNDTDDIEEDWEDYRDLWMWIRNGWVTVGIGSRPLYTTPIETNIIASGATVEFFFECEGNAQIGPKPGGAAYNPMMVCHLTDRGPYTISGINEDSGGTITTSDTMTNGIVGVVWAAKKRTSIRIKGTTLFLVICNGSMPMTIWDGGMMPEYHPIRGQPSPWPDYVAWGGVDAAIYSGRIIMVNNTVYVLSRRGSSSYMQWVPTINYPTQVLYSAPYQKDTWDSADDGGYVELIDTPGACVGIETLRDVLNIYKTDSVVQFVNTGIAGDPFTVRYMSNAVGVDSADRVGVTDLYHYFVRDNLLYQVSTHELVPQMLAASLNSDDQVYILPHSQSVLVGQPTLVGSDYFWQGRALQWRYGVMYELDVPNIQCWDERHGFLLTMLRDGSLYGDETTDLENQDTSHAGYVEFITPQLSMGDAQHTKTFYNYDMTFRWRDPGAGAETPIDIGIQIARNGLWTDTIQYVTPAAIGQSLPSGETTYRARLSKKYTAVYFQIRVRIEPNGSDPFCNYEIIHQCVEYVPIEESISNSSQFSSKQGGS